MQNSNVLSFLPVCSMRPSTGSCRLRMVVQLKDFYNALPHSFPPKRLFHGHAFDMLRLYAVQTPNYVLQFFDVAQAAASIRFPTVKKSRVIPAAIAGVVRSVTCRLTKL